MVLVWYWKRIQMEILRQKPERGGVQRPREEVQVSEVPNTIRETRKGRDYRTPHTPARSNRKRGCEPRIAREGVK